MKAAVLFALLASPAAGGNASYSDHKGVTIFTQPCGAVLAAIEGPWPEDDFDAILGHAARNAMAWGFILGYDTARGGMDREGFTTLELFRAACRRTPSATGAAIL